MPGAPIIFISAAVVSFAGSLQLGIVNMAVIRSVLRNDPLSARKIAWGGGMGELVYAAIAVFTVTHIPTDWMRKMDAVLAIAFLLAGLVLMAMRGSNVHVKSAGTRRLSYFKGMVLSLSNPQLIVFWSGMALVFNSYAFLKISTLYDKLGFVLGAAGGAIFLLLLIARLAARVKERISKYSTLVNRLLGLVFVLAGLQKGFSLLFL